MNIDLKDKRILTELEKNARQTDSEIAKKLRMSKQVVNYRIQNLVKDKVITNFYTLIDTGKLGLNSYYVFMQFEKVNKEQEKTLLQKIKSLNYVGWLVSGVGRWDAVALIYATSTVGFDRLLNKLVNLCGNHLHEFTFTTLISAEHISYKFLNEKNIPSLKQSERNKLSNLDETDVKIIDELSQNARASIVDISEKIGKPVHVVNYHLKSLIKEKRIEGFKPKVDISKLGFEWHLLLIQFQKITEERKKEFLQFCKNHKKVYYVTETLGVYGSMLDVHVKNVQELKDILLELKDKFSDIIKTYESLIIFEEYKISYFPKELLS